MVYLLALCKFIFEIIWGTVAVFLMFGIIISITYFLSIVIKAIFAGLV